MKKVCLISFVALFTMFTISCEKSDNPDPNIIAGNYPVKEYAFERDPKVNVWGTGMDFIHVETSLEETLLDYEYLTEETAFPFDIKFYIVKAYYTNNQGDVVSEGCPAMLLAPGVEACKIGEGVTFFDTCTMITPAMLIGLIIEPEINYENYKNEKGLYNREQLFEALDLCVIGHRFRTNELVIPDGKTEEDIQAVYLVKSTEGAYTKFMVKRFKGQVPDDKKTIVKWQIIKE